jgi:hypothetical protein
MPSSSPERWQKRFDERIAIIADDSTAVSLEVVIPKERQTEIVSQSVAQAERLKQLYPSQKSEQAIQNLRSLNNSSGRFACILANFRSEQHADEWVGDNLEGYVIGAENYELSPISRATLMDHIRLCREALIDGNYKGMPHVNRQEEIVEFPELGFAGVVL